MIATVTFSFRWWMGVITTSFILFACAGSTNRHSTGPTTVSDSSSPANCRPVQHELGEAEICGQPQRIVVLGAYFLESLVALNIQPVGYADNVPFHRGDYTNPGEQIPYLGNRITQPLKNVGLAFQPSIEAIVKLQPDLIIGTDDFSEPYENLSRIAPTLMLDYDDPKGNLRIIAEAINQPKQAEQLLAQTQQKIEKAREAFTPLVATHPRVLLLTSSPQLQNIRLSNSAGLCSSLVEELGFKSAAPPGFDNSRSLSLTPISIESLSNFKDADLVILLGDNYSEIKHVNSFREHQLLSLRQAWSNNAIAQALKASKAEQVYFIPAYLCLGLPGPIGTELYLKELKQQLLKLQAKTQKHAF